MRAPSGYRIEGDVLLDRKTKLCGARLAKYAIGVAAALRVPLWLRGSRVTELVRDRGPLGKEQGDPDDALRAAHGALRILARTRLPWWRNTCLYRAVAQCLVLRRYGIPCHVELGVARRRDVPAPIAAHAWVERAGAAGGPSPEALPDALVVLR